MRPLPLIACCLGLVAPLLATVGCDRNDAVSSRPVIAPPAPEAAASLEPQVRRLINERLAAVRSTPQSSGAWAELAMAYHANDLVDLARPCYEQLLALDANAGAPIWYLLARVRGELGDVAGALEATERALAIDAAPPFLHWRQGFWLLELGKLDDAERSFAAANVLDRDDLAAHVGEARVSHQRGNHEMAAAILEEALTKAGNAMPNATFVKDLLGRSYLAMGQEDAAEGLIARTPIPGLSWPDPWSNELYDAHRAESVWLIGKASRLVREGQPGAALETLQALAADYGDDPAYLKAFGMASFAGGDMDAATGALRRLVERDPGDFAARLNLGFAYEQMQAWPDAAMYTQQALDLDPDNNAALMQMGRIRFAQERYEEAVAALRPVMQSQPAMIGGQLMLARSAAEIGDFATALAALDQAAELNASDPRIPEVARRVQELRVGATAAP